MNERKNKCDNIFYNTDGMQTNNKLIFRNTLLLYGRETITLFIAFFSSRLLLQQLGIEDFGLYGLIGSILAVFSSLRGLFASTIQRFVNVEKGIGNIENVNKIFCSGILIHIGLSVMFVAVVEIAGLICIPTLDIPPQSVFAAYWVLQFSILTTVVTIMTIPYDALLIANEKFDTFAVFSIIENLLKLGIIFLLVFSPVQKVIVYSFLMLVAALVVRSMNAIYCRKVFKEEAKFHLVKDKSYMKQMTLFTGWQFLGSLGFSLMSTGLSFVVNLFGGVAVNAALALTNQTMSAATRFSSSVNTSFRPQSITLYTQGQTVQYSKLMLINTKASYAITAIIGFVVIMMAPSLLKLWLEEVPEYTTEMVQAIFVYTGVRSFHSPIDTLFKASGQLKYYQACELILLSINLPLSWILLHFGYPYYSVFLLMAVVEIINLLAELLLANRLLKFDSMYYILQIFPRCLLLLCLGLGAFVWLSPLVNAEYSLIGTIWKSCGCFIVAVVISTLVLFKWSELQSLFQLLLVVKNRKTKFINKI